MKTLTLAVFGATLLAGSAFAGSRVGVYVNLGGYGPRYYYAPPVYYTPRPVYCAPRVVYYRTSPAFYYTPAYAPIYCAPLTRHGVNVSAISFGWRR